jgi:hypothetical protein
MRSDALSALIRKRFAVLFELGDRSKYPGGKYPSEEGGSESSGAKAAPLPGDDDFDYDADDAYDEAMAKEDDRDNARRQSERDEIARTEKHYAEKRAKLDKDESGETDVENALRDGQSREEFLSAVTANRRFSSISDTLQSRGYKSGKPKTVRNATTAIFKKKGSDDVSVQVISPSPLDASRGQHSTIVRTTVMK